MNGRVNNIKIIFSFNTEKTEQNLKSSVEYKQLKSLLDNGILSKEEFENKINYLKTFEPKIEPTVEKIPLSIYKVENIRTFKEGKIVNYILYYGENRFYFYEIEKTKKVFISINKEKIYFDNRDKFIEYVKQN